jgi:hypothetical protein
MQVLLKLQTAGEIKLMPNRNKIRGSNWESQVVDELEELVDGAEFKRVPGSGALGTILGEPLLTADVKGNIKGFPKSFKIECKTGYGGATQLAVKKEWLDKIQKEADQSYSIPLLFCKFAGARTGVKHFVVMDIETFADIMNEYTKLKEDFDKVFEATDGGLLGSLKKNL